MFFRLFDRLVAGWRKCVPWQAPAELTVLLIAGASLTGLLLGIRQLGGVEPLELMVYDQMVRLRSPAEPDSRLLIVEITEADLRSQGQFPITDQVLAQALNQLQRYQPKVIGLDLIRDLPVQPGQNAFLQAVQLPNVIGTRFLGSTVEESTHAPPGIPLSRVGFNDVASDRDGVVRRNLMFASDEAETYTSFSMRLASFYLETPGQAVPNNGWKLGNAVFFPLKPDSGGYQTMDAAGYQSLLTYRSSGYPAPTVTLTQLLRGQVNPALVRGHIVLIGVTAPSLRDAFFTPYSPAETIYPKMPGVVIHAQMVSQILTAALDGQRLTWFWSASVEIVWIVGWAIAGGCLAASVHRPLVLGIAGIGVLVLLAGVSFALFLQGGWVPVAAPGLAAIATASFTVMLQMHTARQQQQIVMKLLGQQTSPEIASALWQSRDRLLQSGVLAGQMLVATIVFIDIRNFSNLSERHPPEQMMTWLNEFMRIMTYEVRLHHGIVNKFMGDGLLAVFGVPVPRTSSVEIAEDAQQSVACAIAMGDRLQELNHQWQQRALPTAQMRVGIFTGVVMAGSLGGKDRLEYAVIGDSVNIAARLEAHEKTRQTRDCRILIARETLDCLQSRFQVESWGEMQLRGKQQRVEVYEVVGYAQPIAETLQPSDTMPLPTEATVGEDTVG